MGLTHNNNHQLALIRFLNTITVLRNIHTYGDGNKDKKYEKSWAINLDIKTSTLTRD